MNAIRTAAVAGTFYPADPDELRRSVDTMLASVETEGPAPKAIIAPHAGHIYSGPIAASVYARLRPVRHQIKRVVLLGPSHRVGFRGIAAATADAFRTPLGDIPLDLEMIRKITQLPNTGYLDQAHAEEHSLEVHLPFLQEALDDFVLVPLVIGDASKEDVARVLETLWGGDETLIVISSDLSHYHSYNDASRIDAHTSSKIVALDSTLQGEEACGCRPINGLLYLAKQKGFQIQQVDVRNSGDTAGDHSRVVGYGAYMIVPPEHAADKESANKEPSTQLSLANRQKLLHVARDAIQNALHKGGNFEIDLGKFPQALKEERASFVTLNINGQLRGCIGSLIAHRPLVIDVASNAISAAFKDPRFKPLTAEEYQHIDIHLSVLTVPEPMAVNSREELLKAVRPGIDGLIIEEDGRRATYLPSVWDQIPDAPRFVDELRRKAGLPVDTWKPSTKVMRYQTEEFC